MDEPLVPFPLSMLISYQVNGAKILKRANEDFIRVSPLDGLVK